VAIVSSSIILPPHHAEKSNKDEQGSYSLPQKFLAIIGAIEIPAFVWRPDSWVIAVYYPITYYAKKKNIWRLDQGLFQNAVFAILKNRFGNCI